MKALILKINQRRPEESKIARAAEAIKKGGLVVFPTETVYGIGANALSEKACRKIFRAKGRPRDNPLIVHVSGIEMARTVAEVPVVYNNIIRRIWPAPITFIMKARKGLPAAVTAGLGTVAIRMPANKVALALIESSGVPIAAPSANISRRPSATTAQHAIKYFKNSVEVIIDSGRSEFGLESTILDLRTFRILRPGAFTAERIRKAFGRRPVITRETMGLGESADAISPGMKYRHYSPETPLFLFTGKKNRLRRILKGAGGRFAFVGSSELSATIRMPGKYKMVLGSRKRPGKMASNLFDSLIRLDSLGAEFAVVESFGQRGYGLAMMNRIRKASQHRSFRSLPELERLMKGAG